MRSFILNEITSIKMETNPPKEITNAGDRIIYTDGFIYEYIEPGIGWVKRNPAKRQDYQEMPQVF